MSKPVNQALHTVATGISKFSSEFYKSLAEDETSNFICSPLSVSMVLSMVTFGARGQTEKELRSALRLSEDDQINKNGLQSLIDTLNAVEKVELRLANKIYINIGLDVKSEFKVLTETTFRSVSETIDFGKTVEASKTINSWCEEKTNNRIKDLVKPADLNGVVMVMVNAVYFKGHWEEKFDPDLTELRPFHIDENTTKDVPMMRKEAYYNINRLPELEAYCIELPYKSNNSSDSISMFIIFPTEINGLKKIESNFHEINFKNLHNQHIMDIVLMLPKFKVESKFALKSTLSKMGVEEIFEDSADFRGISETAPLKVSRVIQKAFIEVNEEGSEAAAVTGISKFSTEFYKALAEDETSNFICSPLSVSMVLSMVTFGARGQTEKKLRSTLRLSEDNQINKNGFQSLIDTLNAIKKVELRLANKIYFNVGLDVKSEFKVLTETTFRSVSETIDFGKTVEASKTINSWCEEKTNNRIKDVIQPDDLSGADMVLVNAVYFKGHWKDKFDPNSTTLRRFHIDENTTKDVPMMRKKAYYNINRLPELEAYCIELPYKSNNSSDSISMFIIFPTEINGLKKIESNFHEINFKNLHNQHIMEIILTLPKFKVESKFGLESTLSKMGVKEIFENSADFRGISETAQLKVSKVIQKAFIEVNEEGSEAAAATNMDILMCLPRKFIVDKPFIVAIVATETGTQLFNARVVDPSQN
ncbi:antichymotrypsin-2-like [Microplitis mediator]|uniref:antichymotrypsin-2-like n=1 Tax=Microplitis mediator TaxID=375433 RepID=UPI0025558370|nr:antichymotrypsin-2-like [Microplitis mediator]